LRRSFKEEDAIKRNKGFRKQRRKEDSEEEVLAEEGQDEDEGYKCVSCCLCWHEPFGAVSDTRTD